MSSVLDRFDKDKHYFKEPYPHIVIENALPENYYKQLAKDFPTQQIKETLPCIQGHTYRYLANDVLFMKTIPVTDLWKNFFETHTSQKFYDRVLEIFAEDITYKTAQYRKKIDVRGHAPGKIEVVTDTQFVVHTPTDGTTRTTHLDNPQELYAGLLYFRQPNDNSTGGDFEIYETNEIKEVFKRKGREIKEEQDKKLVKTITYKPNTFVMFLNTNKSVHGVTPRQNADLDRLSINIIAETNQKGNEFYRLFDTVLK